MTCFTVNGSGLDLETVRAIARDGLRVDIAPAALERMERSRATIAAAIETGTPVYGLTTGLGSRVGEKLSPEMLAGFSRQTIRGRAQSVGAPLPRDVVRAAMLSRLNSLCLGHAGTQPTVAEALGNWLNAGLVPYVGSTGSIGASDLCQAADIALALIGEGSVLGENGEPLPSDAVMETAGLMPLSLEPRDGLALVSHSGITLGRAALSIGDAKRLYDVLQDTSALSLEAFGANLSPFDPRTVKASGLPADDVSAADVRQRMTGSRLEAPGAARRLQDPLSLRHVPQLHGAIVAALEFAEPIARNMLNGSPDNPCVLFEEETILSCGNYMTVSLGLAVETVSRSLAPAATASLARTTKLLSNRFSELPQYLAIESANSNGLAPLVKIAEALNANVQRLCIPPSNAPSLCADGVEDIGTTAPVSATNLETMISDMFSLVALEQVVAAQALELRDESYPDGISRIHSGVRDHVTSLGDDRPLGREIEQLARSLALGGGR